MLDCLKAVYSNGYSKAKDYLQRVLHLVQQESKFFQVMMQRMYIQIVLQQFFVQKTVL